MDYSLEFARQLTRLVWLLMHQPSVIDEQKIALRALVNASAQGSVRLSVQNGVLVVNGDRVPDSEMGTEELLRQFASHCIREMVTDMAAPAGDLLNTARVIAAMPVEGDQGRDADAKLRALAMRSIRVFFERTAANANPDVVRQFTTLEMDIVSDKPGELFGKLAATKSVAATSRLLDLLSALIEEAARNNRRSVVADMMAQLVRRESDETDPDMRRAYAAAVRRLTKPSLLSAVASVLPRQRERIDETLAVLARAGEEGAEALIEQLVAAPTAGERRIYFDALVHLKAGVPALMHMLGDPRWFVVRNAAELLGELNAKESEPALTDLLKHDNDRVRRAAAASLGKMGGARAGRALKDALDEETDLEVQVLILGALGKIATPDAIQKLRKAAEDESGIGGFFKRKPAAYKTAAQQALAAAMAARAGSQSTTLPSNG